MREAEFDDRFPFPIDLMKTLAADTSEGSGGGWHGDAAVEGARLDRASRKHRLRIFRVCKSSLVGRMIPGRRENQGEAMVAGNSLLAPEFNDFLLAPIGEQRNEMPLSVLSALARLGVDPWREAARLDRLPNELAAQSLAATIGELPGGQWEPSDSRLIAARLVQLLPSRHASQTPSVLSGADALAIIRSWTLAWLVYAALWGTLLIVGL